MWCIKCQADVAAEMAPDNRQVLCASCGSRIRSVPLLPTEDKTRQARELLERWSKSRWSDEEAPEPLKIGETEESAAVQPEPAKPAFRFDEPGRAPSASATTPRRDPQTGPRAFSSHQRPRQSAGRPSASHRQRTHEPHAAGCPPPHFSWESLSDEPPPEPNTSSKLQAFWGQMLAYAGVLALTIGAAFVLLGYFGGPQWQSYTPTGWLITTTGQMLLFLGVVTLVSGGMEQTTETVARRIDALGQRILRIEWASQNHALKGPSIPPEEFPGGPHPSDSQTSAACTEISESQRQS